MYIAPIGNHAFGYNSVFTFRFYLMVGSLTTIRDSVYRLRSAAATAPLPPTGLTANSGSKKMGLTWNPSAHTTSYQIKRSSNHTGPFTLIASVKDTNYTDTGLTHGVQYYYTVSSSNSVGEGVDSETVAVFNVSLKQGPTMLRNTFLDDQGKEICGAYSVSVPCLANLP
jgi:fibronectin type 3 domain-containing protein